MSDEIEVTEEYRVYLIVERWSIDVEADDATLEDEIETWLLDQCETQDDALDKANDYDNLITKLHLDNVDLEV